MRDSAERPPPAGTGKRTANSTSGETIPRFAGKPLPPFGRGLVARLEYSNPPLWAAVCMGAGSWTRARQWLESPRDVQPLVFPPGAEPGDFRWPVFGQITVIEWDIGPTDGQIVRLAKVLLDSGAPSVTSLPVFVDHSAELFALELEKREWIQLRETIQTWRPE